jgi:hypothetical protein
VPLLSSILAAVSALYSVKRTLRDARVERNLQRALRLSDFRQKWIDDLRVDLAEFESLVCLWNGVDDKDLARQVLMLQAKIRMRFSRNDPSFNVLFTSMHSSIKEARRGSLSPDASPVAVIGQQILMSEWERLKADLSKSEDEAGK